jgi:hypothetical protein
MVGDHVEDQIDLSSTLVSVDTFCKIITNRNRSQLARKIFPFSLYPCREFRDLGNPALVERRDEDTGVKLRQDSAS